MAVKQNNADANANSSPLGTTSSASSSSSNLSSGSSSDIIAPTAVVGSTNGTNGGTGGGGGGVKTKINAIDEVDGSLNSNVDTASLCQLPINSKINSIANHHQDNDNYDFSDGPPKSPKNLQQIMFLIEFIQYQQQEMLLNYEVPLPIYKHILMQLARIPIPRTPSEDRQRFRDAIVRIGEFFGKQNDKKMYLYHLSDIWQLLMESIETPSCTLAIIFNLFDSDMIIDAVQMLFQEKISDASIRRVVKSLCSWLSICTFCQNIHLWIVAILSVLKEQQKISLLEDIAYENVEVTFTNLILPILRPKVMPICLIFLSTISRTPRVFHKIVPRIPKVFKFLKNQSESLEDAKDAIEQMGKVICALMKHYIVNDDFYQPVEAMLRECNLNNEDSRNNDFGNLSQLQNNAKAGLVNLGNTCFLNSVLQALANTQEFSRDILLCKSTSPLIMRMQEQIALMLYSCRSELTPSRILSVAIPASFVAGLQQDSSEFLSYLLETLHVQETNYRTNDISNKTIPLNLQNTAALHQNNIDDNKANNEPDKSHEAMASNAQDNLSTIEKTFTGKQATTYRCLTCGFKSLNVDIFRDLQLSFPELKNDCASNYSVQDLLDFYCSPEKLDGDNQYFCERCQCLTDGERSVRVISAPKNLIITLKHFKYDHKCHKRAKLMHKVFHDEKVYVKVCAAESLEEIASAHYDLYASVVHSGYSMDSGHYYTYAADALNRWYKFNDNIVTPSKAEELHNLSQPNTPYILFYQLSARSNECWGTLMETTESATCTPNVQVVKVEMPLPLKLDELPHSLREYVNRDNNAYNEEQKQLRMKNNTNGCNRVYTVRNIWRHDSSDDEDDNSPSSGNGAGSGVGGRGIGCGSNALSFNLHRFMY